VEITHIIASKKQAGFINAILRNVGRLIAERQVEYDKSNLSNILVQDSSHGCCLKEAIFPEFSDDPAGYMADAFSLPRWLVEQWIEDFDIDSAWQICLASNRRPCVYLQPNTLKVCAGELAAWFAAGGVDEECFEVLGADGMIRLKAGVAISTLPGYEEGLFFVQDVTAAKVGRFVDPQAGNIIVDMCAAPGGKTLHMAMLMGNKGRIIATDIDAERLKRVAENAARLGIDIIETVPYEQLDAVISTLKRIDTVLLDVPCSNTGVMAKRVEVRHRINQNALKSLEKKQLEILGKTLKTLSLCNRICYSTCSILKCENSALAEAFITGNTQFTLSKEHLTLADCSNNVSSGHDGGYVAILKRK
jgi:16S rRNA (cytosine967-C5)-methyltransferase